MKYTTTTSAWNIKPGNVIRENTGDFLVESVKQDKRNVTISYRDANGKPISQRMFQSHPLTIVLNFDPIAEKTCTCPCGEVLPVPHAVHSCGNTHELGYEVCGITCSKCGSRSDGGNYMTGEVGGWISRRDSLRSQAEYERQMMSAEIRESELAEIEGGDLY